MVAGFPGLSLRSNPGLELANAFGVFKNFLRKTRTWYTEGRREIAGCGSAGTQSLARCEGPEVRNQEQSKKRKNEIERNTHQDKVFEAITTWSIDH